MTTWRTPSQVQSRMREKVRGKKWSLVHWEDNTEMRCGDIVDIEGHSGPWVIIGRAVGEQPPGTRWRVIAESSHGKWTARNVGQGDISFRFHPAFTPGDEFSHHGIKVRVEADLGDQVRVAVPALVRKHRGLNVEFHPSATNVSKHTLVIENVSRIIASRDHSNVFAS